MQILNNNYSINSKAMNFGSAIKTTKIVLPHTQRVASYAVGRNNEGNINYLGAFIGKIINGKEFLERGENTCYREKGLTQDEIKIFKKNAIDMGESLSDEVLPFFDSSACIRTGFMDAAIFLKELTNILK